MITKCVITVYFHFRAWSFSQPWDKQRDGQTDARPLHTRYLLDATSGKNNVGVGLCTLVRADFF